MAETKKKKAKASPAPPLYEGTPEFFAALPAHRDKWIANALSTAPMTDEDRTLCRAAVARMYECADLPAPEVVFVQSPLVLQFAGGYAAALHWMRANGHTPPADAPTTAAEVVQRVEAVIREAGDALPDDKWFVAPTAPLKALGQALTGSDFGLRCAQEAHRMWQGGNQWSAWDCYLTAFRDIAKLDLDYDAYNHWVTLAERSGPRIVHAAFCLVCDRPAVLTVDAQNRPHGAEGPFAQWRDGFRLFAWHGVRLPAWIITSPDRITAEAIAEESNQEVRRAMIERIGWERYLELADATVLQRDDYGTLLDLPPMPGDEERVRLVRVTNATPEPDGSFKDYVLRVPPSCGSAREAVAWTFGVEKPEEYAPAQES